ncbi:MAG: hypothetical protein KJO66_07745 [Gammaproteobacteria bacterium]|nr:hypothetical protein [Gammaproteobacteria bacterium]
MAASRGITGTGFLLRLMAAAILVFTTYNPSGKSYYHWLKENIPSPTSSLPLLAMAGILLLIGWTIYLRATSRSLGAFGLFLAAAFFGVLVWMTIDWGWISADSIEAMTWIFEVILCGVLAIGISWSHIRRRMTGQIDVDEVEGDV